MSSKIYAPELYAKTVYLSRYRQAMDIIAIPGRMAFGNILKLKLAIHLFARLEHGNNTMMVSGNPITFLGPWTGYGVIAVRSGGHSNVE
jgi:hypothetical protein